jgi:hypothetical protein
LFADFHDRPLHEKYKRQWKVHFPENRKTWKGKS